MQDLLFVAIGVAFFMISELLVRACDKLSERK
jgi:hypothetical protein